MADENAVDKTGSGPELSILKISAALTIIYGLVGVTLAVICDSVTLMLDGLYAVADVIVSFLAIMVVRKIHQPPDEKYHFGYAKYEPFMTAVDGMLIVTICAATIVTGIQDIIHPEPMSKIHLAIIYALISFIVCIGFGTYMKRMAKRCRSSILSIDSQLWIIEGIVSLGVFGAFAISQNISKTYWKGYANYIDPIISIMLAILLLAKPIRIVRESFYDLVDASPYQSIKDDIMNISLACAQEHGLKGIKSVKLRKAGRKLFIIVHFLADKSLSLQHTEKIKQWVVERGVKTYSEVDVTVLFSGR